MFLRLDAFCMSLHHKEESADGAAALIAHLGSLKANMSLRDKEVSTKRQLYQLVCEVIK